MKTKKIKELHTKTLKELNESAAKLEAELVQLRVDQGTGKVKNYRQLEVKKRDLARIKTIIRGKELKEAK